MSSPTDETKTWEIDEKREHPEEKHNPWYRASVVDFVVDFAMADLHVPIDTDTSDIEHRTNAGRNAYHAKELA